MLRAYNRIGAEDNQLEQERGHHIKVSGKNTPVAGSARVLILPADDRRQERLEKVRPWIADQDGEEGWLEVEGEEVSRLLVLVHQMAATLLGFPNFYSTLSENRGLIDGTA